MISEVNKMKINKKMKIDRVFIDKVLGMTESRKDMEDKLMEEYPEVRK